MAPTLNHGETAVCHPGVPATLNLALPSVLVSALNGILATFSQGYVLVLGIYYKLQTFLYLPANGIVQGCARPGGLQLRRRGDPPEYTMPGPPQPSPAEGNPRLSPAGTVTPPFSASVHAKKRENFFRFPSCNVSCVVVSYKWSYMQGNFLAPLVAGQRAGVPFSFPFFSHRPQAGILSPAWGAVCF